MASQPTQCSLSAAVSDWADQLNRIAALDDPARIASLFDEDSHWREALALTWSLTTLSGRRALAHIYINYYYYYYCCYGTYI